MKLSLKFHIVVAGIFALLFTSSFKPTGCNYCAAFTQNGSCVVVTGKTECNNGKAHATYYKYNSYNGNPTNCISGRCETQIELYSEF